MGQGTNAASISIAERLGTCTKFGPHLVKIEEKPDRPGLSPFLSMRTNRDDLSTLKPC